MAAKTRFQVVQVDVSGYDWYVLQTEFIDAALNARDIQRAHSPHLHTYVWDNRTDRVVEEWDLCEESCPYCYGREVADICEKENPLHPVFKNIFDQFLTYAVNDTVNNGDTGQRRRWTDEEDRDERLGSPWSASREYDPEDN